MAFAKIQTQTGFHAAEHAAKKRRATRQINRRKPANLSRRRRYERNPEAWLRFYGGRAMFPYPFSDGHKAIIHETIAAAQTGTGAAVAAPVRIAGAPALMGWPGSASIRHLALASHTSGASPVSRTHRPRAVLAR